MKKISLIMGSLFLVLILAGCATNEEKKSEGVEQNNQETEEISVENNQENEVLENESGVMKKLRNDLSAGKKIKCTYRLGDEGRTTEIVTYIQGDKYKTEVAAEQMKMISVFDGDSMYSWSEGQKTGMKMTMDCIDSLDMRNETEQAPAPQDNSMADEEEFIDTLADAQNLNCEDANEVSFEIPGDIEFSDQCEALKSQQKMLESLNK